jgi:hypothetical protein
MTPLDSPAGKLFTALAELVVCAIWVWLAIWTTRGLQTLTRKTIPFSTREIWLTKTLAVIVGAGGVLGAFTELGLPWYLAVLPAGAVVFFAFRENIEALVVPEPPQTELAYRASWEEYRRLRATSSRSWIGLALVLAGGILTIIFEQVLSSLAARVIPVIVAVIFVSAFAGIHHSEWKLLRWPCPRCGKSFRGFWGTPWMPKRCRYCGLARWEENPQRNESPLE